ALERIRRDGRDRRIVRQGIDDARKHGRLRAECRSNPLDGSRRALGDDAREVDEPRTEGLFEREPSVYLKRADPGRTGRERRVGVLRRTTGRERQAANQANPWNGLRRTSNKKVPSRGKVYVADPTAELGARRTCPAVRLDERN